MRIEESLKLDFSDVLIKPNRSKTASRKDVILERNFHFYHSPQVWEGVPLIVSNLDTTGCFEVARVASKYKIVTCLHKHYSVEELSKFFIATNIDEHKYYWVSIGMRDGDLEKLIQLQNINMCNGLPPVNICIDVPNGQTDQFVEYCKKVREINPESIILAGNVVTPESTQELILHGGVDIVKVGIGSGRLCQTRSVTGCGYPQLSAIAECSFAAHGLTNGRKKLGLVCSDGGVIESGDFAKAIGGGSDFVMAGGIFAGVEESEGEWEYEYGYEYPTMEIVKDYSNGYANTNYSYSGKTQVWRNETESTFAGILDYMKATGEKRKKSLLVYGMSSKTAQNKYYGGKKNYRASEGRTVKIPHKGPLSELIEEILGGLRSTCSYAGTNDIRDLAKCTTFIKVNNTHNRSVEHLTI